MISGSETSVKFLGVHWFGTGWNSTPNVQVKLLTFYPFSQGKKKKKQKISWPSSGIGETFPLMCFSDTLTEPKSFLLWVGHKSVESFLSGMNHSSSSSATWPLWLIRSKVFKISNEKIRMLNRANGKYQYKSHVVAPRGFGEGHALFCKSLFPLRETPCC